MAEDPKNTAAAATAVGWNQKSKDEIRRSVSKTYEDKDGAEGSGTPTEPHTLAGRPIEHNMCCAARIRGARGGSEGAQLGKFCLPSNTRYARLMGAWADLSLCESFAIAFHVEHPSESERRTRQILPT